MPRTPKGFLTEPAFAYRCTCETEVERLRCIWLRVRTELLLRGMRYDPELINLCEFEQWVTQLAYDMVHGPKSLMFKGIMEGYDRKRILKALRNRGATEL